MNADEPARAGTFIFYTCGNAACGLRFPAPAVPGLDACPRCGGPLAVAAVAPGGVDAPATPAAHARVSRRVTVIVDNLRSIYNVGSILRTADGAGLHHVFLCGITPTPDHPKVAKTALGAEKAVSWSYHPNALTVLAAERAAGAAIWALETRRDAQPLGPGLAPGNAGLTLVIGNENAGVDPAVLALADRIVCLPMRGVKRSLNVATAFGAAVYLITEAILAAPATSADDAAHH